MRYLQDEIPCGIHAFGAPAASPSPLFIYPVGGDAAEMIEGLHERLDPTPKRKSSLRFTLVTFETPDWNGSLSPWPAPPLQRGDSEFTGDARATLGWILERLIPGVEARAPGVIGAARGMLGYSMAGLFALWALYQTEAFAICGSCSGALWYDGFADYVANNAPARPCSVYLSLGGREERARDPRLARVGADTKRIAAQLASSPLVKDSTFVLHPGGHFTSTGDRRAAALAWMARRV